MQPDRPGNPGRILRRLWRSAALVFVVAACAACSASGPTMITGTARSAPPTAPAAGTVPPSAMPPPSVASPSPPSSAPTGEVNELLAQLIVVPELPNEPGYERSCSPGKGCVFGPAWKDVERTGCDTRNRVLGSQIRRVEFKPGTRDCKVVSGLLDDPYSGTTIEFSTAAPRAIEIDHTLSATHTHRFDVFPVLGVDAMPLTVSVQ